MSPWEVIESALSRRKPPRDQKWLAQELGIGAQAITNWKKRGVVPSAHYAALAELFGLSMEQIAGKAPAPWEGSSGEWPFPDIDSARFMRLTPTQRGEIQGKVRELIERFESEPKSSGKLSNSGHGAPKRAA
jgi:hypothetical protein